MRIEVSRCVPRNNHDYASLIAFEDYGLIAVKIKDLEAATIDVIVTGTKLDQTISETITAWTKVPGTPLIGLTKETFGDVTNITIPALEWSKDYVNIF